MAEIKSSKEVAKQATNNLDPTLSKISNTNEAIASTLSKQSSAIQQLKDSITRKESSNEDTNKKTVSSLQMSNKYLGTINSNLSKMNTNISSLTNVVSNMSINNNATVSLLGGIQTSLIQITSVLSAFRSDYLLSNSGNKIKGEGYYDINGLRNITNGLRNIRNNELQRQLNNIIKAANYANKSSNSVRGKIGNYNMAKDSNESGGLIDKILGGIQQAQSFAGLGTLLPNEKIAGFAEKLGGLDTSSVGGLLGSMMSDKNKKAILNPLKELGMDFNNSNNPFKRFLGGAMSKVGLSKNKKEREKDPNLVMSSLAPFADDIKDMVELSYQGIKARPKMIPIYATPVWIVNSEDQTNYIGSNAKTHGKDLEEKRLREILEGIANNTKDKYGRELLTRDSSGYHGIATKGFGQERIKKMNQQANQRIYNINHESVNSNSEIAEQMRRIGSESLGILDNIDPSMGTGGLVNGLVNSLSNGDTSLGGVRDIGSVLFKSAREIGRDFVGSHKGGKKGLIIKGSHKNGKRGNIKYGRDETTEEHEIATIDQDTTILNESQAKNSKTNVDILNGQLAITAGISALVDLSSQESILLSQAVNNGEINAREAKQYKSSFNALEKLADKTNADMNTKKTISQFKKSSNIISIIGNKVKKAKTTSEYFNINNEEENNTEINIPKFKSLNEAKEYAKNKVKGKIIGGIKNKLLKNKKIAAGLNVGKALKKGFTDTVSYNLGVAKNIGKNKLKEKMDKYKINETTDKYTNKAKESLNGVSSKLKNTKIANKIKNSKFVEKNKESLNKIKEMYEAELKEKSAEGAEEIANSTKIVAEKEKSVAEQGAMELAAKQKEIEADNAAAVERNAKKAANDATLAAEEKAANNTEIIQEKASNTQQLVAKEAANETEIAVQEATASGDSTLSISSLIKNIATKVSGLPLPAKIALGAAGVAGVGILGAKIISKIKKAANGNKSGGSDEDDSKSSLKGISDEQKKESKKSEKEKKKKELAEQRKERKEKRKKRIMRSAMGVLAKATLGLTSKKVYISDKGDVLFSKDDSPVPLLDEDGNETNSVLNVKDPENNKQFLKRLRKKEFRIDNSKSLKKAISKIKKGIGIGFKKTVELGKNLFGKAKELGSKVGSFIGKNKSSILGGIGSFSVGGVYGLAAYGIGKAIKHKVSGKKGNENKLNQLLLMSSSAYLFMNNKLQKQLDGIENSDFGKKILDKPENAASLLFNTAAGGVTALLSKSKKAKEKASEISGKAKELLTSLAKTVTGEDDNKQYTSDLNKIDEESATMAYAKVNENNNRNELLNSFSNALGFGVSKITGSSGKVTTLAKAIYEKRKEKAIQIAVSGLGYGTSNGSNSSGGASTTVPQAVAAVVKAYEKAGIVGGSGDYNQSGKTVSLDLGNGKTYSSRPDCTGFINAVLQYMGYNGEGMNSAAFTKCEGIKDSSGNISSDWQIIDNPNISDIQPGDICIIYNGSAHHGEIASGLDGNKVYGWSYGSDNGIKKALDAVNLQLSGLDPLQATIQAKSSINFFNSYSRIIRFVGSVSNSGGSTSTASVSGPANDFFVSDLGLDPSNPTSRGFAEHKGTDYRAVSGTPVHTPTGGTVVKSATSNGVSSSMGRYVIIKDNDGKYWRYMHFSKLPIVKNGDTVQPGQQIGYSGGDVSDPERGDSSGPHLHVDLSSADTTSGKNSSMLDVQKYTLTGKGNKINDDMYSEFKGHDVSITKEYQKKNNIHKSGFGNHIYQRDYSNYIYNSSKDSELQTLGDSGCGPAAATVIKKYYKNLGMGKGKRFGGDKEDTNETISTVEASTTQGSVDWDSMIGKSASETMPNGKNAEVVIYDKTISLAKKFREMGFSDAATCGALANFISECGTDFSLYTFCGDGTGLMMWTPPSKHFNWCSSHGYSDPNDWIANVEHALDDLTSGVGNYSREKQSIASIEEAKWSSKSLKFQDIKTVDDINQYKTISDPELAAMLFERIFEGSGDFFCHTSESGFEKTYNDWKEHNMMYSYRRRVFGRLFYSILNGGYLGDGSGSTSSSSASVNGTMGFLNLITDSAVDGSALSEYMSGNNIWSDSTSSVNNSEATSTSVTPSNIPSNSVGSGRYGKGRYGRATDAVGFANSHFISADSEEYKLLNDKTINANNSNNNEISYASPSSNNIPSTGNSISSNVKSSSSLNNVTPSSSAYISNQMSVTDVDENGNKKTTTNVYTDNNKTTLTTNGKSTIVICNNFSEKTKTNLSEILSNFKHLNGTQNNALKVLKAISELIKEENPEALAESANLRLNNDGLEYILRGL